MIDWRTIETAPKDGTWVLLLYEVGHDDDRYRYAVRAVGLDPFVREDYCWYPPTHWAPINPPEDA